jgi:tetratricopeptide (TPR) repeat protein
MPSDPTPAQPTPSPSSGEQQDSISPGVRRQLQACFERGTKVSKDDQDFDYAHEMFADCVARDPSNLVYVEAMMDNLQQKYNNNKKGARLKGFGGRGAFKKAVAQQDWREVLKLGIDLLKTNPWDVAALRAMAEACAALHYNEVELRYLKNALDANPKDIEVNRHCARSLARMGQFDQAIACWHRVEERNKRDPEAPKMISELTMEKTRQSRGVIDDEELAGEGASHAKTKPAAPPKSEQKTEKKKADHGPTNPRERLEASIAKDPAEISNYLELAELLSVEGDHTEVENVLTRALHASGNDIRIREQLENAQIRRARSQVAIAEKREAGQKTDEAHELVRGMRAELNRIELEVYGSRSQRYPQEVVWKYELGVRLKRAGNYLEAIKYLTEAQADPKRSAAAMLEMGECFQQIRQYQKALDGYLKAAARMEDTDVERKKLALYRAGVLATGLKDREIAEKSLLELIELDADYRDAADRLDKAREIEDK